MGMGNLQRMAMQMQQEMLRGPERAGRYQRRRLGRGGVVKAVVTGKQELVSVTIDPSAVDPPTSRCCRTSSSPQSTTHSGRPRTGRTQDGGGDGGLKLPGM